MRTTFLALLAAVLVAVPVSAHAQDAKKDEVLIIPLAGTPKGALKGTPGQFSAALAKLAAATGETPRTARVAKSDITTLVGCTDNSESCYVAVAKTLAVSELIFGKVEEQADGSVRVTLTRVQPASKRQTRTYTFAISAQTPAEAQTQFDSEAKRILQQASVDTEPPPPPKKTVPPPKKVVVPPPKKLPPPTSGSSFSLGRVSGTAWGVTIGGAAAVVLGGVFFALASGKQSDVDDAPTDSAADLDRLADLESTGKTYTILGNSLVIAGVVATAVGGYLIYRTGTAQSPTERRVGVTPTARGRGVAFVFSGRF